MLVAVQHGKKSRRSGAVLPWLVVALAAIFGIVALTMDGGRLMDERRRAQAGADAAALAAAAYLYEHYTEEHGADPSGNAAKAARDSALANGYANDGVDSVVTVNIPPKSGAFAGKSEYVEVIIQWTLHGGFSAALQQEDVVVKARSVARGRAKPVGMVVLAPGGAGTFVNKSLLTMTLLGSSIHVNSDDPDAFQQKSAGLAIADSFNIVGGYSNNGILLGTVRTGVDPVADPLRKIPQPDPAAYPVQSNKQKVIKGLLPVILSPGVYKGGISISGLSIVTMLPGVYIMDGGGLQISGLATVAGVDVVIYNTGASGPAGPISINSLGKLALVAPLTGTYKGIAIFQDRGVNQPISVTGNGLTTLIGAVYAPAAPVAVTGAAAVGIDTLGGAYVCDTLTIGGIASINIDLGANRPAVPEINLVE